MECTQKFNIMCFTEIFFSSKVEAEPYLTEVQLFVSYWMTTLSINAALQVEAFPTGLEMDAAVYYSEDDAVPVWDWTKAGVRGWASRALVCDPWDVALRHSALSASCGKMK